MLRRGKANAAPSKMMVFLQPFSSAHARCHPPDSSREPGPLPQLLLIRLLPTQPFLMHLTGTKPLQPPKGERSPSGQVGLVPPNAARSICHSPPSWFCSEHWAKLLEGQKNPPLGEGDKAQQKGLHRVLPCYLYLFFKTNCLNILAKFLIDLISILTVCGFLP